MTMHGFDISAFQNGIDLDAVPWDFLIRKTSEGTYQVNEGADAHIQKAISMGRPWGFYHYVAGSPDPVTEADFWIDNTLNYWGHGLPCVDWEGKGNAAWGRESYLRQFVQHVIDRTGIKPMIYASSTFYPWQVAADLDCGRWVAQYATMEATYGYEDTPWNEGAYDCAIRQYSSTCHLDGYSGNLDVDKFYGDAAAWAAYVGAPAQAAQNSDNGGSAMEPHDVWEYDYIDPATGKGTAVGGNAYNELYALAHNLTEPYESPAGDGATGSLMDRICYMDMRIRDMAQQVKAISDMSATLSDAIKTLEAAQQQNADPDNVAQAVSDAVQKKLESLKLEVSAQ